MFTNTIQWVPAICFARDSPTPVATLPQDDPMGLGDDQIGRAHREINAEVIPDNDLLAFLTTMMPWNRVRGARGGHRNAGGAAEQE
jgi:hypothetical protein